MPRLRRAGVVGLLFGSLALPTLLPAQSGGKGTQYALLIACSRYEKAEFKQLPYTGNDVERFRQALLATGFDRDNIWVLHDDRPEVHDRPTRRYILEKLALVLDGMTPEDTLVVALSGHGVQFKGDPVSYFVPLDGRAGDKATLLPLNGAGGLYAQLKACKARRKLLVVNACRNDPTATPTAAGPAVELVDEDRQDEVPEGIAAIYSCRAGQKSYYDDGRKLALFFDHVARAWQGEYSPGEPVTLETFFRQVREKTKADAIRTFNRGQIPTVVRDFKGEWVIAVPTPNRKGTSDEKPLPSAKPATDQKINLPVTDVIVERVLGNLNVQFKKQTAPNGIMIYDCTLDGYKLRLTNYGGKDLMIDAIFRKVNLAALNKYNVDRKFVRAAAYKGIAGADDYTALESNLDCTEGATDEMIRHFITAFVQDVRHFSNYLSTQS